MCMSEERKKDMLLEEENKSPNQPAPKAKNKKKVLITAISCALAVVLAGGGLGYYVTWDAQRKQAEREAFEAMKNATRGGWELAAPAYMDGTLAYSAYYAGPGLNCDTNDLSSVKMQTVSDTTRAHFDQYLTKVVANDYTLVARNEVGGSVFVSYQKNNEILYTYYAEKLQRAQVIVDKASVAETAFEYTYTPKNGDTSAFYQYAIMNDPFGQAGNKNVSAGKYADNGMFYVVKFADNSVMLIDGGSGAQATQTATAALVDFLYEITGANRTAGEKVRVACAFISHAHGDHYGFIRNLARDYTANFEFERFAFNFPNFQVGSAYKTMGTMFQTNYPNAQFMKLHTGQSIRLANATIDVITTHEDLASPVSGYTTIGDFNYSSTMIKITLSGKSFFLMADWGGTDNSNALATASDIVLKMYEENGAYPYLESDCVQVGHHGLNKFSPILNAVKAKTAFIPQSDSDWYGYAAEEYIDPVTNVKASKAATFKGAVEQAIVAGATAVYFQSRTTYGFTIDSQGVATLVQEAIRGADTEYLTMLERFNPFVMPSTTK